MKTFSVVILLMGLGIGMATPPPQGESDKVVSQLILESVYILDFAQLRFLTVEQKLVSEACIQILVDRKSLTVTQTNRL
ncbi:hypothetical protein BDV34DRAFT_219198 [Aspergillus parasiticus]|uniref:Uncharacterized protein n=1 Tax=Aspergillus parasiticus TaxID=5067 RepID=A0A5N6E382_ASPPA|nr:hypothetical protein BDV34DRAFT_219198 [Aspergillus parasiticus]